MNKIIVVAFCLLLTNSCLASLLNIELQQIESEWAQAYYSYPEKKQSVTYQRLLERANALAKRYPDHAEPKILQAVIISSNAGLENGFSALFSIHQAKDLLLNAIALDPEAFQGSAYVNLGTLYYRVPGWPIAFGDDEKAEQYLLKALQINPEGIDANYFYGDFLLSQNKPKQALQYFKKAAQAPIRPEQAYADNKLRMEAQMALNNVHQRKISNAKNVFLSSFTSAKAE